MKIMKDDTPYFDRVAPLDHFETELKKWLWLSGEKRTFWQQQRVLWLKHIITQLDLWEKTSTDKGLRVMDFGCGTQA